MANKKKQTGGKSASTKKSVPENASSSPGRNEASPERDGPPPAPAQEKNRIANRDYGQEGGPRYREERRNNDPGYRDSPGRENYERYRGDYGSRERENEPENHYRHRHDYSEHRYYDRRRDSERPGYGPDYEMPRRNYQPEPPFRYNENSEYREYGEDFGRYRREYERPPYPESERGRRENEFYRENRYYPDFERYDPHRNSSSFPPAYHREDKGRGYFPGNRQEGPYPEPRRERGWNIGNYGESWDSETEPGWDRNF
jgi:hypothetical protein